VEGERHETRAHHRSDHRDRGGGIRRLAGWAVGSSAAGASAGRAD